MSEEDTFRNLIRRVRAGDSEACTELVRQYEPAIRLAVHVRLTNPRLRRVLDSTDICQSVLLSFFLRAASGQYELETPEQLLHLLATMARNKLLQKVRNEQAGIRDNRRLEQGPPDEGAVADPSPSPSDVVAHRELLSEFRRRLTAEERQLADHRALGRSWQEIAAECGERPNTLRMRLDRAVERVMNELDLDCGGFS